MRNYKENKTQDGQYTYLTIEPQVRFAAEKVGRFTYYRIVESVQLEDHVTKDGRFTYHTIKQ